MKQEIIRKATVILGAGSTGLQNGGRVSKAEQLCEEFVAGAIEDAFLSVKWPFALKRVGNMAGDSSEFREVTAVSDCIRPAVLVPSNIEWYVEAGRLYFKGRQLAALFYYSRRILENLLAGDGRLPGQIPESFRLLAALSLASQAAFAMYADSIFADGLKKQFLVKLDETRRIYAVDYNLVNSGEV